MLRTQLPVTLRKIAWNIRYYVFGYRHGTAPATTVEHLCARLTPEASLLELGCGTGALLRALRVAGCRSHYCGVDISKHAVRRAQEYADQRSAWVAADIESFSSSFRWDVIVLVESLYYIPMASVMEVIMRLRRMLTKEGMILVRVHNTELHWEYVEALLSHGCNATQIDNTHFIIKGSDK